MLGPILRHSALLQFAFYRWNQMTQTPEPPLFRAGSAPSAEAAGPKPWDVDGRAAALTRMLAGAFGDRVTLLYLPHGRADGTLDPRSRIEAEFDAVCVEASLSCVNMREAFEGMLARHEPPFGFSNTTMNVGHLNAAGHVAIAAALFDELSAQPPLRAPER